MSRESTCIKLPKIYGEKAIALANKLEMVDNALVIQRDEKYIYIPLLGEPLGNELDTFRRQVRSVEVTTYHFPKVKKKAKTLFGFLENKLPPHLLASLPRSMDIVGDIAIVEVPSELRAHKKLIGEAVLTVHKNVKTVLAKAGVVSGTYRVREFSPIAGRSKTETVHKEYGCQYNVDLAKAYFSPRLSYEHKRVASLVQEGETVVDMFAGVGPFSILIAKTHRNVKVYSIDANPFAIEFLRKNIRLNRVEGRVNSILGDARKVVDAKLRATADRVIMNLPEKAIEFVDASCKVLKPAGGIVHFYCFVTASDTLEDMRSRFTETVGQCGRKVEKFQYSSTVRETAPYECQAVLDAIVR
jgi:tRNA (guanine37-N1)-methyltransferase